MARAGGERRRVQKGPLYIRLCQAAEHL
uniref:OSJNBa0052P16.5 protein n=1 Tax=Oryza sativa subsp. japonica TaxID=39947 RepID=Q7X7L2_ORYSJ|nr:OSJNBa0096F01.19 [Oryza sativa Japonica Group]CAE04556.3 OSJNBa0052P16.5 [Oryza sativa Japonica Group]